MARLPYFDLEQASPTYKKMIGARPPLNLYRMLPHGGAVGEGFLALGGAILRESELDPTLRELVILRVGALSGASYEIHQHRRVARKAGVPENKIESVLDHGAAEPDPNVFSDLEIRLIRFTDAVVRDVKAPAPLYEAVASVLSNKQLIEVLMTIGFYMLVSRFLENLEIDIENPPVV
ncbi:carboxymuconolactone decarboxylase family protein [Cupriavidus metallidurans]|uniref:Carboxymuconolactone decarboxylase-like domain-containing protein n=1 Tax=Cupriavidus metallidurans (strain ATCC 43123 / DSM 2839 / NBRC 102507 / CH34) TaxID=266264 RepID=Q1LEC0_CUPMC|nr:carboxymuconolactone decarboxylase family protein [Cupriavidus metallidurans]ABF11506.1 conserved hypothetical protein; putative carboxymuconolactone decarboxylase family [Cupriavidus metallidurans CH34]QGS31352.1 carboxymuconolactone decarboxylase family protein [Cupriavidus metallidurans]UBM07988.1 carboxymuconolactone decarboxylase family protein [Cupriavidus metallidurans]